MAGAGRDGDREEMNTSFPLQPYTKQLSSDSLLLRDLLTSAVPHLSDIDAFVD